MLSGHLKGKVGIDCEWESVVMKFKRVMRKIVKMVGVGEKK